MSGEQAGFDISTYGEDMIESNAEERFSTKYGDPNDRAEALRAGLIDANAEITEKGWEQLNRDSVQLERNALVWLKRVFIHARDDGHDSNGSLVGAFWFDPSNLRHAVLVELASSSPGRSERIDMADLSYGDLAKTVFEGVSDFGEQLLGGQITFFDVPEEVWETIENTLSSKTAAPPRGTKITDLDGLPKWVRR